MFKSLKPQFTSTMLKRSPLTPPLRTASYHSSKFAYNKEVILKSATVMPELRSDLVKLPLPVFLLKDLLNSDKNDLVATIDGHSGDSLTFGDIFYSTTSLADSVAKMGVAKGDRVAIISPNHLYYTTAFLSVSLNQAISTCMNPLLSLEEVKYQFEMTKAKMVFTHPMCLDTVLKVVSKDRVILLDSGENDTKDYGIRKISDLMSKKPKAGAEKWLEVPKDFDPHSLATVPFSSGTTGRSKGVMLTHSNLTNNVLQTLSFEGKFLMAREGKSRGTLLCPLPFYHIYGLTAGLFVATYTGAKMVFMSAFDLKKYLELIVEYKVTRGFVVPPIVLALAKHPLVDQYDLSSLECLMSGAAPLGPELQIACAKRLKCLVKQAWGLTETSPCATITPDDQVTTLEALNGTSGKLAPGTEGKIIDPQTGLDMPYTGTGEVLIRGPQVMKGYLDNEEATRNTITADGWLHTGDIGHFDEGGWLYITDRLKELIKYKGMQVPPAELEAVIASMSQVKDVIVIPVPDEEAGELPRAYVVKQDNASLTAEQVIAHVTEKVAPYKRLRGGVIFIDSVPKSPSGKLLRRVMIEIDRKQK